MAARPLSLRRTPTGQPRDRAFHFVLDGDIPAHSRVWVTASDGSFVSDEYNATAMARPSEMEVFYTADDSAVLHVEPISVGWKNPSESDMYLRHPITRSA